MNTLSLKDYIPLASTTNPHLGDKESDLLHMKLGVYTEVGELFDIIKKNLAYKKEFDLVHIKEKIGDAMWYIACEIKIHDCFDDLDVFLEHTLTATVVINKKHAISELEKIQTLYADDYSFDKGAAFEKVHISIAILKGIALWFEVDFFECLYRNIEKLKKRYPKGLENFEQYALNRDLNEERKTLE